MPEPITDTPPDGELLKESLPASETDSRPETPPAVAEAATKPPTTPEPSSRAPDLRQKRREGRPTILTPQITKQIAALVQAGNYLDTAAGFVGIHRVTVRDWMRKGARLKRKLKEEGDLRKKDLTREQRLRIEFSDAVLKAEAVSEALGLKVITDAARSQWQAQAWILERKHPDRWGRTSRHEVSGPQGQPIRVRHEMALERMTDEELARIALANEEAGSEHDDEEQLALESATDGDRSDFDEAEGGSGPRVIEAESRPADTSGLHDVHEAGLPGELAPPAADDDAGRVDRQEDS